MPRSSASLLREFNNIPRVTRGNLPSQAETSRRAQAAGRGGQVIGAKGFRGDPQEDVNLQLTRSLLNEEDITPTHRRRLEKILRSQDANVRKKHQERLDFTYKKVMEATLRANDPLTQAQTDEALASLHQQGLSSTMTNPFQTRRQFDEENNPALQFANTLDGLERTLGDDFLPMYENMKKEDGTFDWETYEKFKKVEADTNKVQMKVKSDGDKFKMTVRTQMFQQSSNIINENVENSLFKAAEGAALTRDQMLANAELRLEGQAMILKLMKASFPEFHGDPEAETPQAEAKRPEEPQLDPVDQAQQENVKYIKSRIHAEQMFRSGQVKPGDTVILWTGEKRTIE